MTPEIFRQTRHSLDLSQGKLAKLLGVTVITVGLWERGRNARGIPGYAITALEALLVQRGVRQAVEANPRDARALRSVVEAWTILQEMAAALETWKRREPSAPVYSKRDVYTPSAMWTAVNPAEIEHFHHRITAAVNGLKGDKKPFTVKLLKNKGNE